MTMSTLVFSTSSVHDDVIKDEHDRRVRSFWIHNQCIGYTISAFAVGGAGTHNIHLHLSRGTTAVLTTLTRHTPRE